MTKHARAAIPANEIPILGRVRGQYFVAKSFNAADLSSRMARPPQLPCGSVQKIDLEREEMRRSIRA